jgi:CRISPR-associated protein Cmr4
MYKNKAYIIKTKTNLHVGSGDTNFGIVDNEVQRDTITNLPVINASSLKGALRDHFDELIKADDTSKHFTKLFGDEETQGLIKFIDARLLFLPLRSNKKPFYHVTSKETLESLKHLLQSFGIELDIEDIKSDESIVVDKQDAVVEDVECKAKELNLQNLKKLFGIKNLAIFSEEDFNEAISNLPVIARNKLNDGKSENLWYEEVVPRESIFVSVMSYYDNFNDSGADKRGKTDKTVLERQYKKFEEKLLSDDIQIGANASIGYGICNFKLLGASDE